MSSGNKKCAVPEKVSHELVKVDATDSRHSIMATVQLDALHSLLTAVSGR